MKMCFGCDKYPQKYIDGLCENCNKIAVDTSKELDEPQFPFTRPEYLCKLGYQEAYDALPSSYKNDSCFTFYLHEDCDLWAEYLNFKVYWDHNLELWILAETNE